MIRIIVAVAIAIALCILGVYFFTAPAIFDRFDLSKDSIGSSINGLTAPIIGIISAFLLYLALIRQTDALVLQREQMDTDVLFNELQRIEKYIDQFYDTQTHQFGNVKERITTRGIEAMHQFSRFLETMVERPSMTLGVFYQSRMIILIIRSIAQLESRLSPDDNISPLHTSIRRKIAIIREVILTDVLLGMIRVVHDGKLSADVTYSEILEFAGLPDEGAIEKFLGSTELPPPSENFFST
jgi:hypothetical protein